MEELTRLASRIDSADQETLRFLVRALVEKVIFTDKNLVVHYRSWLVAHIRARKKP